MSIKIPAVQSHKDPARSDLNGRWRIDPEALSPAIPIEYDATIGNFYAAILQIAIASLVKTESVGCNFNEVFIRAPGAQKD